MINVPVAVVFAVLVINVIPASRRHEGRSLDIAGALTVTTGLMALVFGINRSADHGWTSASVVVPLVASATLLTAFGLIESRSRFALMPLTIFRRRTLTAALVVSMLLWGSQLAVIFQGTLFMQQALGYSAIGTGVAWLAATCSGFVTAGAVAPRVIGAIGPARVLVIGQVVMAVGLLRLLSVSVDDSYWSHLFPAYLAMGIGTGLSMVAIQVAAFVGIDASVSGLAGGMIETSAEVGGAIGLAVVATVAISRTDDALAGGLDTTAALTEGYQRASLASIVLSVAAAVAAAVFLRRAERPERPIGPADESPVSTPATANA